MALLASHGGMKFLCQTALTFVPELIAIQFSDKRHYQNILDNGVFVNSKKYVRALAGAGNIRRSTVFFVEESLYNPLMIVLNNGRDESADLNPAKFSAYLGLYGSAGHRVSTPSIAVIKDYTLSRNSSLTWVDKHDKITTPLICKACEETPLPKLWMPKERD